MLDRPVWHALTGRQSRFALGDAHAVRLAPDHGFLAAATDCSRGSLAALLPLAGAGDIWLVETDPLALPEGFVVVKQAECLQMVAASIDVSVDDDTCEPLGEEDGAEMFALVTLTNPGPYARHTHRLGRYVGIRHDGRLVAMAGERMRPGNCTEVSGVCTHPDHRGRGYAGVLLRAVTAGIVRRGERPFLHCYADNPAAIALYAGLGFVPRRTITATVLRRA